MAYGSDVSPCRHCARWGVGNRFVAIAGEGGTGLSRKSNTNNHLSSTAARSRTLILRYTPLLPTFLTAMSTTDIAFALLSAYVLSGTEIAYAGSS
eukprot:2712325-Rhodomonas_salina.1